MSKTVVVEEVVEVVEEVVVEMTKAEAKELIVKMTKKSKNKDKILEALEILSAKSSKKLSRTNSNSITQLMYRYFDQVGLEKADFKEALAIALEAKKDSKFNRYHFSFHKTNYRKLNIEA